MASPSSHPLLGFITRDLRTALQARAAADAESQMTGFDLADQAVPAGTKVLLTDLWKDPDVVGDIGFEFSGFRQLSGSCVGVSAGNCVFTLSAVQRKLLTSPTQALLPWWPFAYGRARLHGGSPNPGSGAMVSVMAQTLIREGVMPYAERGKMPDYAHEDGLALDERTELQYSDGDAPQTTQYLKVARRFPVGGATILRSVAGIKAALLNGYPVNDGCAFFVGHGAVQQGVALGRYDARGGHATSFLGYWEHDNLGPFYLYSNQWAGNTYPEDSSGKGRCCVWMREADVAVLFRAGGGGGETVALSHLTSFPVRPEVMGLLATSPPK